MANVNVTNKESRLAMIGKIMPIYSVICSDYTFCGLCLSGGARVLTNIKIQLESKKVDFEF